MGKGHLFDIRVVAEGNGQNVTFSVDPDPRIECKPQDVTGDNGDTIQTCRLVFNKWNCGMKKKDHYLIQYILIDKTGMDLKFPQQVANAFWVHRVNDMNNLSCPQVAGAANNQVKALAVIGDDTLLVLNKDSNVEWYAFTLNFLVGNTGQYVRWDPIKDNQNGGGGDNP